MSSAGRRDRLESAQREVGTHGRCQLGGVGIQHRAWLLQSVGLGVSILAVFIGSGYERPGISAMARRESRRSLAGASLGQPKGGKHFGEGQIALDRRAYSTLHSSYQSTRVPASKEIKSWPPLVAQCVRDSARREGWRFGMGLGRTGDPAGAASRPCHWQPRGG
jgi:hypothetical protein